MSSVESELESHGGGIFLFVKLDDSFSNLIGNVSLLFIVGMFTVNLVVLPAKFPVPVDSYWKTSFGRMVKKLTTGKLTVRV
jgi:hypothetical protein